jgi:small subunit ribosomal protein S4
MGRYTGAKGRINRRLATMVYESTGAVRALERRETPPGMYGRRKKMTTYGSAFAEKQKMKHYYGVREAQLRRYFELARKTKGNTGQTLMLLCERRLDNVVRRAGFVHTRPQARQGIVHSHFQLNGRTVSTPSITVNAGDVITVRNRPNLQNVYRLNLESGTLPRCDWISFDPASLKAIVTSLPGSGDISVPVDIGQIVTFMAR